jgi:transitional endoplasmic reticulum ATPase
MTNDVQKQLAAALAQLVGGGTLNENVRIKYQGSQIVIPEGMSEDEAIVSLTRRRDENNMAVAVSEVIHGYPLDALLALQRAMAKTYGWTGMTATPGFFGPRPPTMVGVVVDDKGTTVSVPWGRMTIPGIKGWIAPGITFDAKKQPMLQLQGEVQRRYLPQIARLAALARQEVEERSIYRGKAIRIEFPVFDEDNEFNPQVHVPSFLHLNGVSKGDLIFKDEVMWAVQTSIFTPIESLAKLREMGTPFRRGVLASGEYGVGKTLLANVTAKLCEENDITFIYLAKTSDIANARMFARQYSPAVIFAEDVDAILSGSDRDEGVNDMLNVIDGIEGKHDEVMVIFSTNHPEKINRALLRPGRLDAVITVEAPDASAAERLIRMYARDTLSPKADITEVAKEVAGSIPAAIREVVERAKLAAIPRAKNHKVVITDSDLLYAARSMRGHLAMLKEKPVEPKSVQESAATILGESIADAIKDVWGKPSAEVKA